MIAASYIEGLIGKQVNPTSYPEPRTSRMEAAWRVIRHASVLREINPFGPSNVDVALRAALTYLVTENVPKLVDSSVDTPAIASALRFVRLNL